MILKNGDMATAMLLAEIAGKWDADFFLTTPRHLHPTFPPCQEFIWHNMGSEPDAKWNRIARAYNRAKRRILEG